MTSVKKRGALLAKGRVLGIQFDTLFTDDLYFKISRHAIEMAERVKDIIREKGWKVYMDSPTNQQLILMTEEEMDELGKTVIFDRWGIYDEKHTIVRLATSWSTSRTVAAPGIRLSGRCRTPPPWQRCPPCPMPARS